MAVPVWPERAGGSRDASLRTVGNKEPGVRSTALSRAFPGTPGTLSLAQPVPGLILRGAAYIPLLSAGTVLAIYSSH